jgi:hypothetical protein
VVAEVCSDLATSSTRVSRWMIEVRRWLTKSTATLSRAFLAALDVYLEHLQRRRKGFDQKRP